MHGRVGGNRQERPKRRKRWSFLLVPVLLWGMPVIAAVASFSISREQEHQVLHSDMPETAILGESSNDFESPLSLELIGSASDEFTVSADGLVTQVDLQPQATLESGSPVLSLDDRLIRAHVGASPLTDDVLSASTGPNVDRLRELLTASGHLSGDASELRGAIDAWNAEGGLPRDGVFRASSVIFVASANRNVEAVLIQVGDRLSMGDPVLSTVRPADDVRLSSDSGALPAGLRTGAVVISAGGDELVIPSLESAQEKRIEISQFVTAAAASGALTESATDASRTYTGATVRLETPIAGATVANSAVYVAPSGDTCIFMREASTRAPFVARKLEEEVAFSTGVVIVTDDMVGREVNLQPQRLDEQVRAQCA